MHQTTTVALLVFVTFQLTFLPGAFGHGMMQNPPSRSSMWRFGFNTPTNYNDNELFCGGFEAQYNETNQGRCGECGDEWSLPRPRPNDEGGLYGTGVISNTYSQGQLIEIEVNLTKSHLGFFEFRLCPNKKSADEMVSQECFDEYLLKLEDGSTRYMIGEDGTRVHYPKVQLPSDIICDNCVIQWTYTSGNNWGYCEDGTGALGCGPQETFRNCADVAII